MPPGPVHSIQMQRGPRNGRLIVPEDHRQDEGGDDCGLEGAQVICSGDRGRTWQLGAVENTYADDLKANEASVVSPCGNMRLRDAGDGRLSFVFVCLARSS